jgi:CheY-like chemotaxis protein
VSYQENQKHRNGNPAVFVEGLEARQMMSTSVISVFSNYGIPKPATDNVLLMAMGEANTAASPAVMRAAGANQAGRALGVSSVHSFAGRPPEKEQLRRITNAKGRLLLVEDDASTRRALTTILQKQGWNVTNAGTVAEGIRMLAMRPDHVIVDLMLPDGDGAQLLAHANASNLHPHMTVTTGVADSERLERVRELGAEAILRKPINLPELLKQLGN